MKITHRFALLSILILLSNISLAISGEGQWVIPASIMPTFQKGICNAANSANPGIVWPTTVSTLIYQNGIPGCLSIQHVHEPAIITIQSVTAQNGQCTINLLASQSSLGTFSFINSLGPIKQLGPANATYQSKNGLSIDTCQNIGANSIHYQAKCNPSACPGIGIASCSFDVNGNETDICNQPFTLNYDSSKGSCIPPSCNNPDGPQFTAPLLFLDSQCTQPLPQAQYTIDSSGTIHVTGLPANTVVYTGGIAPTLLLTAKNSIKDFSKPIYQCQGPYSSTTTSYGCGAINYGPPPSQNEVLVKASQDPQGICDFNKIYLSDANYNAISTYNLNTACAAYIPTKDVLASNYIQGNDATGCYGAVWPPKDSPLGGKIESVLMQDSNKQ